MLWNKGWFEIRWGALYILLLWIGLAALFIIVAFFGIISSIPNHVPNYGFLPLIACLGFIFLAGSGVDTHMLGLMTVPNERTTVFTLSLPVTRRRLVLTRSAIGLIAAIVVNIPFELFVWYFLGGKTAIFDISVLFLEINIFGICMYCLVTLLTTFVRGSLSILMAYVMVFMCLVIASGGWAPLALRIINIEESTMDARVAIPWLAMVIYLVLAVIFLFTAIKVVESRDY